MVEKTNYDASLCPVPRTPLIKENKTMKKLFASSILTAVAVPFLMAAPAASKAQNTSTDTTMSSTAKKTHKKKVKKNSTGTTESSTAATSTK